MVKIIIPNNYIPEREYIVEIFFKNYLGVDYEIHKESRPEYKIILENNNVLVIKDHFFIKQHEDIDYINLKNIPEKAMYMKNIFLPEKDIPVIFGDGLLKICDNKIICGIDIFSSAFFMLTRWEEITNHNRDKHNRFSGDASFAYQNNYLHRPVVNEYVEMLWNMLKKLKIRQKRGNRCFEVVLSHDIDNLLKYISWKRFLRRSGGDLIKRKSLKLVYNTICQYYSVKKGNEKDPFDCFDYLMEKSEFLGIKSRFYFMAGGNSAYDNNYSIEDAKNVIKNIVERNHIIGFHASYNSYNNEELWKAEKDQFESMFNLKLTEGRQHYLRFKVPDTWRIWNKNSMEVDSSCCYADVEGYRCGTGDEFRVFDVMKRKKMQLIERPLVIMEGTLKGKNYRNFSTENAKQIYEYYLRISKKYNSKITLLWHNSSFDEKGIWKNWESLYNEIIALSYTLLKK